MSRQSRTVDTDSVFRFLQPDILGVWPARRDFATPIRLCKPFGVLREFIVIKMLHDQHGERARLNW